LVLLLVLLCNKEVLWLVLLHNKGVLWLVLQEHQEVLWLVPPEQGEFLWLVLLPNLHLMGLIRRFLVPLEWVPMDLLGNNDNY
jgi:hypothetical protein